MALITASEYSKKLFRYITKEKKDVTNIYFYAIINGLVSLSIPLGIQSIISFVMGCNDGNLHLYPYIFCGFGNLFGRTFQAESFTDHRKNSAENIC